MEEYKKVDINEYVSSGIQNGILKPFYAVKYGCIGVREGIVGETIITWSSDELGNEIKEKVNEVKLDKEFNRPQFVVTKLDEEGNTLIDKNGHPNEWIVNPKTLYNKYEMDQNNPQLFHPKATPQLFVQVNEDIILNQFGGETKIAKGGFINISNPNDMYGISLRDFIDTYKPMNELNKQDEMKL